MFFFKPIKTTRVHDNPEVLIHHDVITDREINLLIKLATPYVSSQFNKKSETKLGKKFSEYSFILYSKNVLHALEIFLLIAVLVETSTSCEPR